MHVRKEECEILRELGRKVAELSATEDNLQKMDKWTRLTDLDKRAGPATLVHLWPLAWAEALPDDQYLECEGDTARRYERELRQRIWAAEHLHDDSVIEPVISYPHFIDINPYPELPVAVQFAEDDHARTGAYKFDSPVKERSDIEKIGDPEIRVDWDARKKAEAELNEVFDGILEVIPGAMYFSAKVIDDWAALRGMESVYMDMLVEAEWTHEGLQRVADNFERRFKTLEELGVWGPFSRAEPLGSNGLRFNPDIPNARNIARKGGAELMDTWGSTCAEGFNCVSPGMHEEFALPYTLQLMKLFKWINIGCCEAQHDKVAMVRSVPNARRISISEWCDVEKAGAEIGTDLLYGYKPSGVPFIGNELREDLVRAELRRVLEAARACPLEIILNIGGTLGGGDGAAKLVRWTQIAEEEIDGFCG